MQAGQRLTPEQLEGLAMEFAVKVMLDNISQHGYKGSKFIVSEFFRTLDDLLNEFHGQNVHRKSP